MNPKVKEEWLKRLRSRDYKQARSWLYKEGGIVNEPHGTNGYCCLGVLCEMYYKEQDPDFEMDIKSTGGNLRYWLLPDGQSNFLPEEVRDWADLESIDPATLVPYGGSPGYYTLSSLNDGGKSFEEIADIIERDL